jgi:hypothetical protein
MGSIYSAAQVTIIACAGVDLSHGLPGVSAKRPVRGALEHMGPCTMVMNPHPGVDDIRYSAWANRAWTLQGGYLSKRKLFFTDGQLIYICDEDAKNEL